MGSAESKFVQDARRTKKLQAANQKLKTIPKGCFDIKGLEEVWLQHNDIDELPPKEIQQWTEVELVYLKGRTHICLKLTLDDLAIF